MRQQSYLLSALTIGLLSITAAGQQKTAAPPEFVSWLPVTDAQRNLKSASVEKDAGAEVLIWRVHVVDELLGNNRDLQRVFYHYVRVKVFDEKGKEDTSTIDLTYREPGGILDVSGRTIKSDGTVLELDKKSIYRREVERAGRAREKAVSFAMPGVEPGTIIEYRWKQTENDNRFRYIRLHFQRDFPVQQVTYFVKPLSSDITGGQQMYLMKFNCEPTPIKVENDGFNSTTVTNIPAGRHEPYAPSDPNVEPWALLYYSENARREPEKFWNSEGKKVYNEMKGSLKASDEVKAAVGEVVAGAGGDEARVTALAAYVQKHIRNLFDSQVTMAEREKFFEKMPKERERTAAEIFKAGIAMPSEMNVAFAALATQAGLEVRPALIGSRGEVAFAPQLTDRYFLDDKAIAVKLGSAWKIVDVSHKHLMPGMLPWDEEGMAVLVSDPKTPVFIQAPMSPPEASVEKIDAHLKLSDLGALSGSVEESFTGHRAEDLRGEIEGKTPAQREEWLHDRIVRMFPDAEVTGIELKNADDPTQPLAAKYRLEAPHYAQVTGKRILFQPSAFRRGVVSPFTASERHFPIHFPYAWKEVDEVWIALPEGFVLDNADNPGGLDFGEIGSYKLKMEVTKSAEPEFHLFREFAFGNKGILFIDAKNYAVLKRVFGVVQTQDSHTISLKGN